MTPSFFLTMNSNDQEPSSPKMVWRRIISIKSLTSASAGEENNTWCIGSDTQRTTTSGYQGRCFKIMRHWTSGNEINIWHSELYLLNFFMHFFRHSSVSFILPLPYPIFRGGEGCKPVCPVRLRTPHQDLTLDYIHLYIISLPLMDTLHYSCLYIL